MRIVLPEKTDLRSKITGSDSVIDADTGQCVGALYCGYGDDEGLNRHIELFDRYSGLFATHEECIAFAKGVEAVLRHMIEPKKRKTATAA